MSLINHRRSAYVDDDEMERAAGLFEITAEDERDATRRCYYAGAACALRLLNGHDFKTCNDLLVAFNRAAFDING